MTDIVRRTIVAPANGDRVALIRVPMKAGSEYPIPVDAEFLGWEDGHQNPRTYVPCNCDAWFRCPSNLTASRPRGERCLARRGRERIPGRLGAGSEL